jgi:D-alanyl-D-alanine carboxypeptidase
MLNRSSLHQKMSHVFALALAGILVAVSFNLAEARGKFAFISVDASNGKVLYSKDANARRYPASLTKIMTLYILFEELKAGRVKKSTKFKVSRHAAARPPSKLYFKPGQKIRVDHAILALVTKSANDVAATVAENISGSESAFAKRMTRTARRLGMSRTVFKNASGLPNKGQYTTARDMATLGLRVQKDYPQYYGYFKTRSFKYKGRSYRNHNRLLGKYRGVDGIKTGFIRASGFNLTASVRRDGKHIVAVVMGGRTGRSRNNYMVKVLNEALKKVPHRKGVGLASTAGKPASATSTKFSAPPKMGNPNGKENVKSANSSISTNSTGSIPLKKSSKTPLPKVANAGETRAKTVTIGGGSTWSIQIGAYATEADARAQLRKAQKIGLKSLKGKQLLAVKYTKGYRAHFAGFNKNSARKACDALKRKAIDCFPVAPQS